MALGQIDGMQQGSLASCNRLTGSAHKAYYRSDGVINRNFVKVLNFDKVGATLLRSECDITWTSHDM